MKTHASHPKIPAERMAAYAKVGRNRGLMALARMTDTYAHDMEVLRWAGDAAAAAHMLRDTMLLLAGEVADNARQLARKERALVPRRAAEAGFDALGAAVIAAALAAERKRLAATAPTNTLEPGSVAAYAGYLASETFDKILSDHGGLVHDRDWLLARGRADEARALSTETELDLVRVASRPTPDLRQACVKAFLIKPAVGRSPTLASMLAAAEALEGSRWELAHPALIDDVIWQDDFPGEAERCAAYAAGRNLTQASALLAHAEAHWRNLEALAATPGPAQRGCLLMVMDAGLAISAIPARDPHEAERKLEFMNDFLVLFGTSQPLAAAMVAAALRVECGRWDVLIEDRFERGVGPRH